MTQPFLKWAGGKRQLLPQIRELVPARYGRYFEPFVGGGAVFFDLRPTRATLSDSNERLVKTYRAVRDDVEHVIRLLSKCPYDPVFYEESRNVNVDTLNDVQTAAWFIYMNRAGFNGLYRVNKEGKFNVPFGSYKNPLICDADRLRACSLALRDIDLYHLDFAGVLNEAAPGDFVYFDPPYIPLNDTSNFTAYQAGGFSMDDHTRLRNVAKTLLEMDVHVVLSASFSAGTLSLYDTPDFELIEVSAKRQINSRVEGRGKLSELLIRGKQSS